MSGVTTSVARGSHSAKAVVAAGAGSDGATEVGAEGIETGCGAAGQGVENQEDEADGATPWTTLVCTCLRTEAFWRSIDSRMASRAERVEGV